MGFNSGFKGLSKYGGGKCQHTRDILNTQKKGSKDKRENYKGITLLPQTYKILSSVLYNRVVRYAEWF